MTVGEHIRKCRIKRGLTQPEAGRLLGVSSATVLNWELGKKPPLITQMGKVIAFLGYYPFPDPTSLGEQLLRKRRGNGWSIKAAAEAIGVDPSTWRDWEAGELVLYRKHRDVVAEFLGVDADELTATMKSRWLAGC